MRRLMAEHPRKWLTHLKRAAAKRVLTNVSKYNKEEQVINLIMIGAKQRCTNKKDVGYDNYGNYTLDSRTDLG